MLGPSLWESRLCRVCSCDLAPLVPDSAVLVSVTAVGRAGGGVGRAPSPGVRGFPLLLETCPGVHTASLSSSPVGGDTRAKPREQRGLGWACESAPSAPVHRPASRGGHLRACSCCSSGGQTWSHCRGACQGWDPRLDGTCWGHRRPSYPCSRPVGLGSFPFSRE